MCVNVWQCAHVFCDGHNLLCRLHAHTRLLYHAAGAPLGNSFCVEVMWHVEVLDQIGVYDVYASYCSDCAGLWRVLNTE